MPASYTVTVTITVTVFGTAKPYASPLSPAPAMGWGPPGLLLSPAAAAGVPQG